MKGALYQAMLASPHEDGPRLVYADALTERGDPRGEFIVLQCRLAARRLAPAAARAAREREAELLDAHREEWFGPLEKWLRERDSYSLNRLKLSRGFASHCRLTISDGKRDLHDLFAKAPLLDSLELRGDETHPVPQLAQLRRLEAEGDCASSIFAALETGLLDGLVELRLGLPRHTGNAEVLQRLKKLTTLSLTGLASERISLPPHLQTLSWERPPAKLFPALLAEGSSLERLALTRAQVDATALKALTQLAPRLEALALDGARFSKQTLDALLRTRWPKLQSLDLSNVGLGPAGARLVAALDAPVLEALDLTYTRLTDDGAKAVLASPLLAHLKSLSLRANKLSEKALAGIQETRHQLHLLNLKKNPLSAAFLKKLAKAFPETRLTR